MATTDSSSDSAPVFKLSPVGQLVGLSAAGTTYPYHPSADPSAFALQTVLKAGELATVLLKATGTANLFAGTCGAFTLSAGWGLSDDGTAVKLRVTCKAGPGGGKLSQLRVVTGVDMSMATYPSYNTKMMPGGTVAGGGSLGPGSGCATTAIMLSPDGKALLWASPQALDSYQVLFDGVYGGHRVNTLAFDLINAVDPRNPGFTHTPPDFTAGQTRSWDFFVVPLPSREVGGLAYDQVLDDTFGCASVRLLHKPAATWTSWAGVNERDLVVYTDPQEQIDGMAGNANLTFVAGATRKLSSATVLATTYSVKLKAPMPLALPPLTMTLFYKSAGIDKAAVVGSAVYPWEFSWYANVASSFVAKWVQPKCGQSCEQYMSAFAIATAQRFGGRSASRQALLEGFVDSDLMAIQFDKRKIKQPNADELLGAPGRIQNTSCAMDICRLTYLAAVAQTPPSADAERFLNYALDLAQILLRHQAEGGGLFDGGNFYTSVYYPAKSLMDLADCLAAVPGREGDAKTLQPHIAACMADLLSRGDNIGTEGQSTYEDGAIACTALQLAQFARHGSPAPTDSARYIAAAKQIAEGHRCLEYRTMDSRCNGASMRFWESFYGIGWSNCLNTPHGWSSWTGQMHYQLYLSTQDTYYLHKFMTNITASLSVLISPAANGMCYYLWTPDPTIGNPAQEKVAGCVSLDIPTGQQIRENTTGEPFEVIKLLHDTVLSNAHVYWHSGAWRAISATLEPMDEKALRIVPHDGVTAVWINYASASTQGTAAGDAGGGGSATADTDAAAGASASAVVFELSAVSAAGARVEIMGREEPPASTDCSEAASGVATGGCTETCECEDDGWVLA